MSDVIEQWRDYLESGRSFAVQAERGVTEGELRANRTGIVVASSLAALVLAGLVVLVVADFGRLTTSLLVGLFLVLLLVIVVRLAGMRRRLRAYLSAADPFVVVSAESVTFSGIPPIAWRDVLGVLSSDLTAEYEAARGLGGWLRRAAVRTGGATIPVALGIERAGAYRAGATGGLAHDLIVVTDENGQAIAYLDHALPVEQARQVVTAIKVAASLNGVGFLASNHAKDGFEPAAKMLKGERLEPRV
ncbi:hypothetical protein ACDF64_13230 [Agromyces sp. MMS24-JH15]|uniref:hypothetical protein n=1 Tax=Agromyces sp. MMS24-JH15 TaxID=3243765 RepID=UPI00374789FC